MPKTIVKNYIKLSKKDFIEYMIKQYFADNDKAKEILTSYYREPFTLTVFEEEHGSVNTKPAPVEEKTYSP